LAAARHIHTLFSCRVEQQWRRMRLKLATDHSRRRQLSCVTLELVAEAWTDHMDFVLRRWWKQGNADHTAMPNIGL
jgi:hypothetical protein